MDESSGKRATDRLSARKSPSQKSQDCSSRSTSSKAPTASFLEKTRPTKTSINGKEIGGSSSRTPITVGNSKKTISETRRRLIAQSRSEAPENGSVEDEKDGSNPVPPGKIRRGLYAHSRNPDFMEVGSSSSTVKKTNPEREKKMNRLLPDGRNINSSCHGRLSISDSRRTRSTESQTLNGASSAPARSSVNANTRTRLSMEPSHESSSTGRPTAQRSAPMNGSSSTEPASRRPFSSTRVRNGNSIRSTNPVELGPTLSLQNLHHYTIDGVAEHKTESSSMDESSGKRATDRLSARKPPSQKSQDCSSRSTSSKAPTASFLEKTRPTKTSINGKEIGGSSSRTPITVGNSKKTISETQRRRIAQSRSEAPENGSVEDEKDGSNPVPPGKIRRGLYARSRNPDFMEVGSSSSTVKKTNPEREKKMNRLLPDGRNINSSCHGRLSISDSRRTRSTESQTLNGTSSAPARSSVNGNTRTRLSMKPSHESSSTGRPTAQRSAPINGSSSTEPASRRPFSSTRVKNRNGNSIGSTNPVELGSTLSLQNLQHYTIDGVAELLSALESIEQDEELTYEQLILLESRLFSNGIAFYDQHRDMRLDIDDMSYEELLALEDRMGSVSTALTEEAMSRCLTRSVFCSNQCGDGGCSGDKNPAICCICQEEYVDGEEVGRLECKHWFHEGCIQQWLRQKNWCPVCKASAQPPS